MDALWLIADIILTPEETERCSVEELFLLCCTFYVHDLGMSIAATNEGVERLRSTAEYKAALCPSSGPDSTGKARSEVRAIRIAARGLHAEMAQTLMVEPVPGLGRYLIEDTDMRDKWGQLIGEIAASHHWTLQQLETRLGARGIVPTPDGGSADLGYVACLLRTADYAHINRERALQLERLLRSDISDDSSLHWDAQTNITGPKRDASQLVYGCTAAVTSIDAWWLFYDMISGLDTEVRSVRDYLDGRRVSAGRFTLQGVRGAESPESFASFVLLKSEVAPIDIRVQPNSMERVIDLLGGPALYLGDPLAPIRELIQNCRDAIALRNALETIEREDLTPGKIEISLNTAVNPPVLKVRDNGVGMTRSVVKNHLISVASNFWSSVDFARDFSRANEAGFEPIGRFGIGFLSVFMLGTYIEVETERAGSPRVLLRLRGIGRRGELVEKTPTGRTGTEVRIHVTDGVAESLTALADVVRARAPMLPFQIRVEQVSKDGTRSSSIPPRWWATASSSELYEFLDNWQFIARTGGIPKEGDQILYDSPMSHRRLIHRRRPHGIKESEWPGTKPEVVEDDGRLVDSGTEGATGILECSHGIAIDVRHSGGVFGLVELGEVAITPNRDATMRKGEKTYMALVNRLTAGLIPRVRDEIDKLEQFGSIPARHNFLRELAVRYGPDVLAGSSLRWIPTLEQPGNLIHRSRTELKRLLESESSAIVSSGITPSRVYELAAHRLEAEELRRSRAIPLPSNEFSVNYQVEKRLDVEDGTSRVRGTFGGIIEKTECKSEQFLMLGVILDLIAEAWSTTRAKLEEQQWEIDMDTLRSYMWVYLKRPQLTT
jgi:hypothetical protein